MTYYKVVTKLGSAMVPHDSVLAVKYKIGEFVKSPIKGSKLFVFSSLSLAQTFVDNIDCDLRPCKIYKCEVKNPSSNISIFQNVCGPLTWTRVIKLWKLRSQKKKFKHLFNRYDTYDIPPKGSVFVDEVKLIKVM